MSDEFVLFHQCSNLDVASIHAKLMHILSIYNVHLVQRGEVLSFYHLLNPQFIALDDILNENSLKIKCGFSQFRSSVKTLFGSNFVLNNRDKMQN